MTHRPSSDGARDRLVKPVVDASLDLAQAHILQELRGVYQATGTIFKLGESPTWMKNSGWLSAIFGSLLSGVKDSIASSAERVWQQFEEHVLNLQKKLVRSAIITLCICVGCAALLVALCLYLYDVQHLPRYAIFLILGIILLVTASVRANIR
jgi:hypothetical protein